MVAAWLEEGGGVDTHCIEREDITLLMEAAAAGQEAVVRKSCCIVARASTCRILPATPP